MSSEEGGLRVYRDAWAHEHLALLCGIANAGGGALLIASGSSSRARDMKRLRKPFEQIPQIAQHELGITCTTHPLLDGAFLRLEITVPSVPADNPLRYNGAFRFYDEKSERNLTLSLSEIKERRGVPEGTTSPERPQDQVPVPHEGAESAQDLIEAFSEIVGKLAGSVEGAVVHQEGNSFTISFPDERGGDASMPQTAGGESTEEGTRVSIKDVDPGAKEFSSRSVAAANKIDLTSTDEYVLSVLHANGRATAANIAMLLGVSESTVRRSLRQLKNHHLIERVGSNKAGYWRTLV